MPREHAHTLTHTQPILNKMTDEQEADKVIWTPSKMIERLGREIDNEESIYYWCAKVSTLALLSHASFPMPAGSMTVA